MKKVETTTMAKLRNAVLANVRQCQVIEDRNKEITLLTQKCAEKDKQILSLQEEITEATVSLDDTAEKLNAALAENARLAERLKSALAESGTPKTAQAAQAPSPAAENAGAEQLAADKEPEKPVAQAAQFPKMFGVKTVLTSERLNRGSLPAKPAGHEFNTDYTIYTHGACLGNGIRGLGFGGWAAVLVNNKTGAEMELSGNAGPDSTNQVMELSGVLNGLEKLSSYGKKDSTVTICADSQYVLKGITEWSTGWRKNGWCNASGNPVKNKDLWVKLLDAVDGCDMSLSFEWTKGHADHYYNSLCDLLATAAAAEKAKECNCHEFDENIPTY